MSTLALPELGLDPVVVTVDDPAAGAEAIVTVPGHYEWTLIAVSCDLATSAAAANRVVEMRLDDGTTEYAVVHHIFAHPASNTCHYMWGRLMGVTNQSSVSLRFATGMPDFVLPAGHRLTLDAHNLQAGDQISEVVLNVLQRSRVPEGPPRREYELVDPRLGALAFVG